MSMFHDAQRRLQDAFGSRALADRLESTVRRDSFTDADAAFITDQTFFFLATADGEGRPDCSFKGGAPGFVRVTGETTLAFPDYDGNGMFKSLGNIEANPHVGLLFISMGEKPSRLRVNGQARVVSDPAAFTDLPGAQLLVEVTARDIFPNCPRYIPNTRTEEPSIYAPTAGEPPVEPAWKSFEMFADVVPPRRR